MDLLGHLIVIGIVAAGLALLPRVGRLPRTFHLVIAAVALGLAGLTSPSLAEYLRRLEPSPDLFLFLLAPPILLKGALDTNTSLLRGHWTLVGTLSLIGTLLSAVFIAFAVHYAFGLPLKGSAPPALLIGIALAPTDPLSGSRTLKALGARRPMLSLVQSESVLNNGIATAAYLVLFEGLGSRQSLGDATIIFTREATLGILVGTVMGLFTARLVGRAEGTSAGGVLSLALAYGAYLVANAAGGSGPLAVVAGGLSLGSSEATRLRRPGIALALGHLWGPLAFLSCLVAVTLAGLGTDLHYLATIGPGVGMILLTALLGRFLVVYGIGGLARLGRRRFPFSWLAVLNACALRSPLCLPMAIGLSASPGLLRDQATDPNQVQAIGFGVFALSALLQGGGVSFLLTHLGLSRGGRDAEIFERMRGRRIALEASAKALDDLHLAGEIPRAAMEELRELVARRRHELEERMGEALGTSPGIISVEEERAARRVLEAERTALEDAFRRGLIGEETLRTLLGELGRRLELLGTLSLEELFREAAESDEAP